MHTAPSSPLTAVCLVLVGALALPVRAETHIALLPSAGDASRTTRKWVDEELRQALASLEDVRLQDADETGGHLASLEDLGMVCSRQDLGCLVKLGLVAGVEGLIVPGLEMGGEGAGGEVEVELDLIDVTNAARVRTARGTLTSGGTAAARALVRRVLGIGAPTKTRDDERPPPRQTPEPAAVAAPVPWGFVMVGVGAVVTAVALPTAVVSDLLYAQAIPGADARTRRDVLQPLGAGMWVATIVGGAVLGIGAATVAQGDDPGEAPPPAP